MVGLRLPCGGIFCLGKSCRRHLLPGGMFLLLQRDLLPLITIIKLLPVPSWIPGEKYFTKEKRKINRLLVKYSKEYNNISVINAENILPDKACNFDMKGKLNGRGLELFRQSDLSKG